VHLKPFRARSVAVVAGLAVAVALGACGSSSSSSSSGASASTSGSSSSSGASASSSGSSSSASGGVAEAQKLIAPYVGQASKAPTLPPLKKRSDGAKVDLINQGDPETQAFLPFWTSAAKAMGWHSNIVQAGTSASTVSSAMDAEVQRNPAGLTIFSIPPQLYLPQLKKLQSAGSAAILSGGYKTEPIIPTIFGTGAVTKAGSLLADYVLANGGNGVSSAFVVTPEIQFSTGLSSAYKAEMSRLCPSCAVGLIQVPVTQIGSTASSTIANYLQAHPEKWVVASLGSQFLGLAPHLKAVGASPKTLTFAGGTLAAQNLKAGTQTADLAVDFPYLVWQNADMLGRMIVKQPVPPAVTNTLSTPSQFLTQKDITFPVNQLWQPPEYQNMEQTFTQLWSGK
jgi:ABC-type sugar transport system substrate-binding protein